MESHSLCSAPSASNLSVLDATVDSEASGTQSVFRGGGGGGGGAPLQGGTEACRVERLQRMAAAVRELIECMGEDASREGLLQTPARSAKALLALAEGYTKVRARVAAAAAAPLPLPLPCTDAPMHPTSLPRPERQGRCGRRPV